MVNSSVIEKNLNENTINENSNQLGTINENTMNDITSDIEQNKTEDVQIEK